MLVADTFPLSVWPTGQQTSQIQRKGRYVPDAMAHPGKMLPAIARQAIETYTESGDIVVDPMCGIGTTLVEAMHLGRRGIGVEYEQRWTDVAQANLDLAKSQAATGNAEVHHGDGRDLATLIGSETVGKVALVLTSPPYGTSLHGHVATGDESVSKHNSRYSDDRANLGNAPTPVLLEAFADILASCARVLRPGGIVAITTRPWRLSGYLVDLPGEVVRLAEAAGLEPFERNVVLLCALREDHLVPRASFFQLSNTRKAREQGRPLSVIAHEDLIVLR